MQMIHYQPLDQFAQSNNKVLCPADLNDGFYNRIIIGFLVQNLCLFSNQFFNHISKICRKGFSYFGSCIFGGCCFAYLDQTV